MKKLLSILGTITIAGSGMAGLVGNAPAKNEINSLQTNNLENLNRFKRTTENTTYEKEYLNDINGIFVYHYNQKYFSDSFDLTDLYGYSDWNEFKNNFNFFEIKNANVNFNRHDNKKSINDNLLIKWDIKNMRHQDEFNENIENNKNPIIYPSGDKGYPGASIDDYPFMDPGKTSISIFNQSLKYKATYHQGKIDFAMQKYLKNNHLMLRIIYKFWLDTAGSTEGANLKLSTKGYKFS